MQISFADDDLVMKMEKNSHRQKERQTELDKDGQSKTGASKARMKLSHSTLFATVFNLHFASNQRFNSL